MTAIRFIPLTLAELNEVTDLLKKNALPYDDINLAKSIFLIAKDNNTVIGAIGIETYGNTGLLRSFVVANQYRSKAVGKQLYDRIISEGKTLGINRIYLLTTTAEKYFSRQGFTLIERDSVPDVIKSTSEFKNKCPATAACMVKDI